MRTRHVVFHYPASGWRTGVAPVHQPGVDDHVRYLQSLDSSGAIVMAGPFMDTDCGGMLVLHERIGRDEAIAIATADPAVASGLIRYEVRTWHVTFEATPAPSAATETGTS